MELINEIKKVDLNIPEIANNALDFGLRTILPDFIEEDVIEIKNAFINEGFAAGIQETLDKIEDVWKSIKGIFSGEFDSVEQIKRLIQKNGILDTTSSLIDKISKNLLDQGIINKTTYSLIKTGKKEILDSLEVQLKKYYKEDEYSLEKLSSYCQEWKDSYKKGNYEEMKNVNKKIEDRLKQSENIEKTIKAARDIEKIENYIEKRGSIEDLSDNEKKLLNKLIN